MTNIIKILNAGVMNYMKSLALQKHIAAQHHASDQDGMDTIIFVEHPPVYTIGIRTKDYTEEDQVRLQQTGGYVGAEFYKTNRGGLITFHGPGQLVVYPILNLKHFKPSMKWYICHIEKTVIDVCTKFGLKANTSPHTGVWIGDNKICAIGVHGSRFVTTHGLAINCCTDLEWYKHIVPCGIKDKGVTTLTKELNRVVTVEEVMPIFLDCFKKYFNCNYIDYPQDEKIKLSL
ncbi:octanoyltransferase [Holotrichia oblita]|uniref:Octanoyltransferase n=1 Tax=Holotrichia oblita TaxID=644536 RepID=A0ACB9SX24_HOLOL|nr:octanoyltransferase [Holotrichia oblita]